MQNQRAFLFCPLFSEKPGKQNCSGVSEKSAEQEITMCFLPEVSALKHVFWLFIMLQSLAKNFYPGHQGIFVVPLSILILLGEVL